jgi:shikimate dehydrogenase
VTENNKTELRMIPGKGVFIPQAIYGIIGQPLEHSLSPLTHNWGFQSLRLDAVYLRWPLDPGQLADFILAARTLPISGFSVTIPHKRAILPLLDGCTPYAMRVGAVNTVYWEKGLLWGENTDVQGFLSPLPLEHWRSMDSVLVLGNGGAARAALVGLTDMGVRSVTVSGRNQERSSVLASEFGVESLAWEKRTTWHGDLLVNTTPLGMAGTFETLSPWPNASLVGIKHIYDLVYNPLETKLILQGQAQGVPTISGLEMFLGQACAQFSLWTRQSLPLAELRKVVSERLARSA